jgi:hypothetical protein
MWNLYTMKFYLATMKKEILSFTGKWMELKNIIFCEVNQAQMTNKSHGLPHLQIIDPHEIILLYMSHTKGRP